MIQGTDGVTQTVNHLLQGGKDFVSEATLPNFLPNLFYRIHFRCVRRNVKQNNIVRQLQNGGSVPCRTITAKQNNIISVFSDSCFKRYSCRQYCNRAGRESTHRLSAAPLRRKHSGTHGYDGRARWDGYRSRTNSISAC